MLCATHLLAMIKILFDLLRALSDIMKLAMSPKRISTQIGALLVETLL